MIRCAIFDLDGTLLDTITTITHYVNLVLDRHGIPVISEDECKYFVGNGARKLIDRVMESRKITDSDTALRVYEEYNREYNADTLYLTKPYDGIKELLLALKERKISLAVLSNKPDEATKDIIPAFFPNTFAIVHGGRDGIMLKPAPDGVLEILDELGASPDELMYVGDTNVDMFTGKNAGARMTVGVSWGFRTREELKESGADVIVDTPSEIINLLNTEDEN